MNNTNNNNKKPSHFVYTVKDGGKYNDYWTKIGVAFAHNDGKGFSVMLEAFPVDGKITIRTNDKKPQVQGGANA